MSHVTTSKDSERRLSRQKDGSEISNELNCVLHLTETQFEGGIEEEQKWECIDKADHILDLNIDFNTDYKDLNAGRIQSGVTRLHAESAIISETSAILRGQPKLSQIPKNDQRRILVQKNIGKRSVLVVRIEAKDASTGPTEKDLARTVFGVTNEDGTKDNWNLASGYNQCSYGQLKFEPTSDTRTNNGVYTLSINANVK